MTPPSLRQPVAHACKPIKVDNVLAIAGEERGDRGEVLAECGALPRASNRAGLPKAMLGHVIRDQAVRCRLSEAGIGRHSWITVALFSARRRPESLSCIGQGSLAIL
jgi:hypothetical protein